MRAHPARGVTAGLVALAAGALVGIGSLTGAGAAPFAAAGSQLDAVACASASNCFAVGVSATKRAGPFRTLIERWNGKRWSVMSSPNTTGASSSALSAVACANGAYCFAAGRSFTGSASATGTQLMEQWDGERWTTIRTPKPAPGADIRVAGISCPSKLFCLAVGTARNARSGASVTYAEQWNGTKWSTVVSPNPAGGHKFTLNAVSCTSTLGCAAVGDYVTRAGRTNALVLRWNGKTLTTVANENPAAGATLAGVSCATAPSCLAGGASGGENALTFGEHWNGKRWSIVATPSPGHTASNHLFGVSCTSSSNCIAVGGSEVLGVTNQTSGLVTLTERWNGLRWSIVSSANPAGRYSRLAAVSCPSSTKCFAVGRTAAAGSSGPFKTLVERFDGKHWSIVASPNGAA